MEPIKYSPRKLDLRSRITLSSWRYLKRNDSKLETVFAVSFYLGAAVMFVGGPIVGMAASETSRVTIANFYETFFGGAALALGSAVAFYGIDRNNKWRMRLDKECYALEDELRRDSERRTDGSRLQR